MNPLQDKIPADSAIIGYITTGAYSLAQGETRALGACLINGLKGVTEDGMRYVFMLRHLLRRLADLGWPKELIPKLVFCRHKRETLNFVLVRGVTGRICRPARFELLA